MEKDKTNPRFSFVLPAYKGRFLREAIHSILGQTIPNFELIIVDDNSPDHLENIVNEFSDARIKYIRNKVNIGGQNLVRQWNQSIAYAKGEYTILASDDDIYDHRYLEEMESLLLLFPNASILRPSIRKIDELGSEISIENYSGIKTPAFLNATEYLSLFAANKISSGIPMYMFKTKLLRDLGGFVNLDLGWFSDDATVYLVTKHGGMAVTGSCLFSFRIWGNSISGNGNKNSVRKIRAAQEYFSLMKKEAIEEEVWTQLIARGRQISLDSIQQLNARELWLTLHAMEGLSSEIFPLWWRIKRIAWFIFRKPFTNPRSVNEFN